MFNNFSQNNAMMFQQIFEHSNTGIIIMEYMPDKDEFMFLLVNNAFYLYNSFIDYDVIGKLMSEVFPNSKNLPTHIDARTVYDTGKPKQYTLSYNNPIRGHVHQTFYSFKLETGEIVSIFSDITDLKNSEHALQLSEQKLRRILDSADEFIFIVDSNYNFTFNSTNSSVANYITSKNMKNLKDIIYPDDWAGIRQSISFVREEGKKTKLVDHRIVNPLNGELNWWACTFTPLFDDERQIIGVMGVDRDVNSVKVMSMQLDKERDLYQKTIQSIGDGLIIVDTNNKITLMNDAAVKITGFSQNDAIAQHIGDIYNVTDALEIDDFYKLLDDEKPFTLKAKNGKSRTVIERVSSIGTNGGDKMGRVIVFRDISNFIEKHKEVIYLNYHDKLTGLFNRKHLEILVNENKNEIPSAILTADINGLRYINSMQGYEKGNSCIKETAEMLVSSLPANAIISRSGDDDFTAILPGITTKDAAGLCMDLKTKFNHHFASWGNISLSAGYSVIGEDACSISEAIEQAEKSMNSSKLFEMQSVRSSALGSLLTSLQARSFETEEHAQRLKDKSLVLGRRMGLGESDLNHLALLAVLHDVGKIAVPDFILNKPGSLTDEEWRIMRNHTIQGDAICGMIPELAAIAPLVMAHHERFDGKGYPQGLKGEEIPLLSRIITLIDSFDAMTNDRVYKKAMSFADAVNEIESCAGKHFDPDVTRIFVELYNEGKIV